MSYVGVMTPEGLHTKVIESLHYPGGLAIDAAYGYVTMKICINLLSIYSLQHVNNKRIEKYLYKQTNSANLNKILMTMIETSS